MCHKSAALSGHLSKGKVYQGLCDWIVGALPIPKISWLVRLCWIFPALSPLLSKPLSFWCWTRKKHSQTEFIWKFSVYVVSRDPACGHPVARKRAGEILISVFGSGTSLPFPDLPSRLSVALGSRGTAPGSFLQAEPSLSVRSALRQANFHLFGASFFPCESFILLTFPLLPVALQASTPWPLQDWKKKLYFNFFCELCLL